MLTLSMYTTSSKVNNLTQYKSMECLFISYIDYVLLKQKVVEIKPLKL